MSLIPTDFFGGRRVGGSIFDLWDPFSNITPSADTAALANTRIDWRETADAHVFTADLPGLRKDEVKVEVEDGNVLRISGEKAKEKEENTDTWHRVERCSGQFMRKFRLPENAKVDEVRAALENGVLTVTIPKFEERKTDVKSITVS